MPIEVYAVIAVTPLHRLTQRVQTCILLLFGRLVGLIKVIKTVKRCAWFDQLVFGEGCDFPIQVKMLMYADNRAREALCMKLQIHKRGSFGEDVAIDVGVLGSVSSIMQMRYDLIL